MAAGTMSPSEVKSEINKLEISPSKNAASSPVLNGGSKASSKESTSGFKEGK